MASWRDESGVVPSMQGTFHFDFLCYDSFLFVGIMLMIWDSWLFLSSLFVLVALAGSAPPAITDPRSRACPGCYMRPFFILSYMTPFNVFWDSSLRRSRDSRIAYLIELAGPGRPN